MFKDQSGIATILGLFLIGVMLGGVALVTTYIKNPTIFRSRANDVLQRNIFSTTEEPQVTQQSTNSLPSPEAPKPKLSVTLTSTPALKNNRVCIGVKATQDTLLECKNLELLYSTQDSEFYKIAPLSAEIENNCNYIGEICSNEGTRSGKFRMKAITDDGSVESDEFGVDYNLVASPTPARR